jgi:hypothetical protein
VSDPIVIPLRSKRQRRGLAIQKLNHAVPAFGLLLAGTQALAGDGHGFGFYLGIVEIASAATLIVLTIRELRGALGSRPSGSVPHTEHHGIDWVDIAAGSVLVTEALEHWHETGHVPRPTLLTAAATFALGLSHGRIRARAGSRRVLRVDAGGIAISGRLFKARRLQAVWRDLQSIEIGQRWAVVTTRAGQQRRLDLTDLETEGAVRCALAEARNRLRLSEGSADSRR